MTVLGPCPCQGCRRHVTWDGWSWMSGPDRHHCQVARARARYNEQVGISDAITDIMCDALSVADTNREGVPRLEVSAP